MNKNVLCFLLLSIVSTLGCEQSVNQDVDSVTKNTAEQHQLSPAGQTDIDNLAEQLEIKFELLTNLPSAGCDENITDGLCYLAKLSLTAKQDIHVDGWQIFYSQIAPIHNVDQGEFTISHLNGDLHKISLTEQFSGFKQGQTKVITYRAGFWSLAESDIMPNYMITGKDLSARVIASTKPALDGDTKLTYLPFVAPYTNQDHQFKRNTADKTQWLSSEKLFERNSKITQVEVEHRIIPTPSSVQLDPTKGSLDLSSGIAINYNNVQVEAVSVALQRIAAFGVKPAAQGINLALRIEKDSNTPLGSYQLVIATGGIDVIGVDAAGVANGLNSIASLLTIGQQSVPLMTVADQPHYQFRGVLIDVARNFHSKDFILRLLDQMAAYKLNKLHLHLGDDEGWRIEIPSLPELTEVGAYRCLDLLEEKCLVPQLGAGLEKSSTVNGFYSVAEYQEILKAASLRHIQVIPSLDMPSHSRAAIKAMEARTKRLMAAEQFAAAQQFNLSDPQETTEYTSVQFYGDNTINVCLESSFNFVTEVMSQVKQIHADAGQPLTRYHIGADETAGAWIDSPACKAFIANNDHGVTSMSELGPYFIERVAKILSSLDIETAGWSDGLSHTRKEKMPTIVQSNAWDVLFWQGHDKVHELANRDWQVVISAPDVLYFDFPYEADPKEHGYYWASRATNTEKVFQFMPDNLPVHAEFWTDRLGEPYQADDSKIPLLPGRKFYGVQGQLWSENTRTDNMAEYKLYPRLFALAERAWHLADWAVPYNYQGAKYDQQSATFTEQHKVNRDQDWTAFANTLGQKALKKLEQQGVFYRLPTVGAQINDGILSANIAFPGLAIEYKDGAGQWTPYQQPVAVNGSVLVRSSSFDGKRKGRTTSVITQ